MCTLQIESPHINLYKVTSKNMTFLGLQRRPAAGRVSAAQHTDRAAKSET